MKITIEGKEHALTLEQFKAFIKQNLNDHELQKFLTDDRAAFIASEDGKKIIQPLIDSAVSTGLTTYKEKTFPGLVDEAVTKKVAELNPKETSEQKQIREQNERIKKLEGSNNNKDMVSIVVSMFSAEKISGLDAIIPKLIGDNIESTRTNTLLFIKTIKDDRAKAIKGALDPRKPNETKMDDDPKFKNPFSEEHFNLTEQGKLFTEKPEFAAKLQKEANK